MDFHILDSASHLLGETEREDMMSRPVLAMDESMAMMKLDNDETMMKSDNDDTPVLPPIPTRPSRMVTDTDITLDDINDVITHIPEASPLPPQQQRVSDPFAVRTGLPPARTFTATGFLPVGTRLPPVPLKPGLAPPVRLGLARLARPGLSSVRLVPVRQGLVQVNRKRKRKRQSRFRKEPLKGYVQTAIQRVRIHGERIPDVAKGMPCEISDRTLRRYVQLSQDSAQPDSGFYFALLPGEKPLKTGRVNRKRQTKFRPQEQWR